MAASVKRTIRKALMEIIEGKNASVAATRAAGVSASIDGALRVAALFHGDKVAQEIQLYMEYAPEPPFQSGTPDTPPSEILEATLAQGAPINIARTATAHRIAKRLGIAHEDLSVLVTDVVGTSC